MEHTNKMKRERIQLLMMVGMYLSMLLLLVAIIVMVKNVNELKSDPIVYGIEKKNFMMCSCYDMKGTSYNYNAEGIIPDESYGFNIQLME